MWNCASANAVNNMHALDTFFCKQGTGSRRSRCLQNGACVASRRFYEKIVLWKIWFFLIWMRACWAWVGRADGIHSFLFFLQVHACFLLLNTPATSQVFLMFFLFIKFLDSRSYNDMHVTATSRFFKGPTESEELEELSTPPDSSSLEHSASSCDPACRYLFLLTCMHVNMCELLGGSCQPTGKHPASLRLVAHAVSLAMLGLH